MDNKFVHIDHLFKEGLTGGEEHEREGSWMRMRELLDKEMPVGAAAPARRPLRRYWMPALLLLLVTSAGGSYYFLNKYNAGDGKFSGETTSTGIQVGGNSGSAVVPGKESLSGTLANNQLKSPVSTEKGNSVTLVKDNGNVASNHTNNTPRITYADGNNNSNADISAIGNKKERSELSDNTQVAIATSNKSNIKDKDAKEVKHNNANDRVVADALTATNANIKQEDKFSKEQIKATQKELKVMADNGNLVALQDGPIVKKSEQEITKLAVKERAIYESTGRRSRKFIGLVMDTTSVSKKKEVFYEKLTPLEVAALNRMELKIELKDIVPMSSGVRFANGERGIKLMALSEFKVKSKKTAPEKINEMIGDTRNGIASLFDGTRKYYAALMLGGNASIGNPSAYGLQLGIAGFYTLSERWTLGAELKYFNRSLGNYKLSDEFVTFNYGTPTVSGAEFLYSYEEKNEGKYYKVQNFASVELPITLTYNLGRVSIFGGPNLAYGFTMHPLVSTEINSANKTLSTSTARFPYASESAKVVSSDFKSRLGLGYVFGMTYDLSRSFSLDARVTQNVWDNAASEMSKQLSNAVFRKPSFQFGLNIYFGRREKVTYILER